MTLYDLPEGVGVLAVTGCTCPVRMHACITNMHVCVHALICSSFMLQVHACAGHARIMPMGIWGQLTPGAAPSTNFTTTLCSG